MTDDEVRDLIRQHATKAGSIRALAKEWGMSQAYLDKQIRGVQAVGDKTLLKLRLVRRKVYQFYPITPEGLISLAHDAGLRIAKHDVWREEQEVGQRPAGHGAPMTSVRIARLLAVSPKDMARLLRIESDFPKPDARVGRAQAWKPETVYSWIRSKCRTRLRLDQGD